jgi:diketogulonate reductase-like aldo/keto reductase
METTMSLSASASLRSGAKIPLFGLGTWLAKDGECFSAVDIALKRGYRLIDTAAMYKNETEVGRALKSWSGAPPFVTTKLMGDDHESEPGKVRAALEASLKRLGLDSVDLYLIHSPQGGHLVSTWKAMLDCRDAGLAKDVGVSNFGIAQLEGLANEKLEAPAVNQIECHAWLQQNECRAYCASKSIRVMGYCPLARTKLFGKTPLRDVALRRGFTEADIAIRWSVEAGIITIPKSVNKERIASNAACVDGGWVLSEADRTILSGEGVNIGFKASNSVNTMDLPWDEVR